MSLPLLGASATGSASQLLPGLSTGDSVRTQKTEKKKIKGISFQQGAIKKAAGTSRNKPKGVMQWGKRKEEDAREMESISVPQAVSWRIK